MKAGPDTTLEVVVERREMATATLNGKAAEIRDAHKAAQQALRSSVAHAIHCGELLIEAKDLMPHGAWSDWIATNTQLADRTARGYMRLARLNPEKRQRVADLSLRQALKEIGNECGRQQRAIERQVDRETEQIGHPSQVVHLPSNVIDLEPSAGAVKGAIEHADHVAEHNQPLAPPSRGMDFARMALFDLKQITRDDTERDAAFSTVRRWLDENEGLGRRRS